MIDWLLNKLATKIINSQGFWVVRQQGSAFGIKKPEDANSCFRIQMDGLSQWGDGVSVWDKAFGPIIVKDRDGVPQRCLFEFNGPRGLPVGITLTDMESDGNDAISLTAENGNLVIRNELTGDIIYTINGRP